MNRINVTLVQTDIVWEDKQANLNHLGERLKELQGTTDIVIVPEMFSTGFSVQNANIGEPVTGSTISTLRQWAEEFQTAICGSYIAADNGQLYNRAFFLTPEGGAFFYDKRHLFRMGGENDYFSAGDRQMIIPYREWNICLLVCYDLRFPVWSRNVNNSYDLLICVANWPAPRRMVWDTLLRARALENLCYVCGVNRTGTDAFKVVYNGGCKVYSPLGKELASIPDDEDGVVTTSLSLPSLRQFREKFPTWKDADSFQLTNIDK